MILVEFYKSKMFSSPELIGSKALKHVPRKGEGCEWSGKWYAVEQVTWCMTNPEPMVKVHLK